MGGKSLRDYVREDGQGAIRGGHTLSPAELEASMEQHRQEREARLRAAGKTNREDAERELNDLRATLAQDKTEPYVQAQMRVRGSVRVVNPRWVEVKLQLRVDDSMPWLNVLAEDHPVLMRRDYPSEKDTLSGYVELAIRRFLCIDAGLNWMLGKWEARVGQGVTEYRAWLNLRARSSVAVRTRDDGMLNLYGLI